ncbi:ABC transporter permease [Limosilactobacillus sp.]|uniref:ABC transporter permease n=1 Tax=Limosilactobacillus sp. TaxID=2773925 RepID=UPI00345E5F0E
MLYFKLVNSSFRRNGKVYLPYLMATSILVAINYIFAAMGANASLKHLQTGAVTTAMIKVGITFVLLITAAFLIYVNRFLWQERSDEFGLYEMLGMTSNNVQVLIIIEKLYLLVISLAVGLVIGVIFEKLAFLGLKYLLAMSKIKQPWIQWDALFETALMIFAFFLVIMAIDSLKVRLMSAQQLWKTKSAHPQRHGLLTTVAGITGIILLGITYYTTLTIKPRVTAITHFMLAVVLLIVGTYLLFIAGSVMILSWLQHRKNYYYQPKHFIAVSGMRQRMQQNGASLATICLLCSAILVIIFTSISLYLGINSTTRAYAPQNVLMMSPQSISEKERHVIHHLANRSHAQILHQHLYQMSVPTYGYWQRNRFVAQGNLQHVSVRTDAGVIMMTAKEYGKLSAHRIKIKPDQALTYRGAKPLRGEIKVMGQSYHAQPMKTIKNYYNPDRSTYVTTYLIVKKLPRNVMTTNIYAFDYQLQGKQKRIKFEKDLSKISPTISVSGQSTIKNLITGLYGGLIFVGILTSLALAVATAIVLYFKQISEGYADRRRFVIMQEVGLSEKETAQAIHSQVLMVFLMPVVGAIINMLFALPAIRQILHELNFYNQQILIVVGIVVPVVLLIIYIALYAMTTRTYQQIIDK